jgi:alcohol dehydrogenase
MLPEYFEFHNPVKLLCGQTALENIPYEMGRLGCKKPFLLVSRTMLESGILEMMGGRYQALVGTDIPKDSSFAVVEGLAKQARDEGCDGILAIGGGSVLDTAKAVRVLLSQGCTSLRELLGSEWLSKGANLPFLMVPTTAGTGSECTGVAVVQDDQTKVKQELISDQFLPDVAVLDPRATEKLPPRLTASSGMDALTHAIEAYTGLQKNPISSVYAFSAVQMIGKHLIAAVREPKNSEYRLSMACASTMAGIAFSNSMVGLVHAIAHSLGAVGAVPHGEAVGIMLPKVMRWQMDAAGEGYGELLAAFCGLEYAAEIPYHHRGEKLVDAIEDMLMHLHQKCGLPVSLKDVGISRKELRQIAQLAIDDGALLANPKPAEKSDVMKILEMAL